MHKPMLVRHLKSALQGARRSTTQAHQKYGDNHIMTTTMKMEEKELADYISKLENELNQKEAKT